MKKKNLILSGLVIILAIIGGIYWYFNVYQKPIGQIPEQPDEKLETKRILQEWLNKSLKQKFLPPKLDIELGVDMGGEVTRDKNTWGYNWHYLEKDFYTALDYNNKKPGINTYILAVFWEEKIVLNQEIAQKFLENYFNFSRPDLKCETRETFEEIVNSCQGNWLDEKENWHSISIVSIVIDEINHIILMYFSKPLESETYGKI